MDYFSYDSINTNMTFPKKKPSRLRAIANDSVVSLPPIEDISKIWDTMPPRRPELIKGVLLETHKLGISGESKQGKSMLMIELAVALATGTEWLGIPCEKVKVLYVNGEVDPRSFNNRVKEVCTKKGLNEKDLDSNMHVWSLRGFTLENDEPVKLDLLVTLIIELFSDRGYKAIIFDPIYKVMEGDENKALDVARCLNQFDRLSRDMECASLFVHHYSKGDKSTTRMIDRASGSGVFARDPDAIITVSNIESDNDFPAQRIEFTLREFGDHPPIESYYQYPLHVVTDSLKNASYKKSDSAEMQKQEKADRTSFMFMLASNYYSTFAKPFTLKELIEYNKATITNDDGTRIDGFSNKLFKAMLDEYFEIIQEGKGSRATLYGEPIISL